MQHTEHLAILRALADSTRLTMLRTLGQTACSAEDLATRLGLAPSTVSFHLKKLEQAGLIKGHREQYYRIFTRDDEALAPRLLDIVEAEIQPAASTPDRVAVWREEVIRQYMRRGRLLRLPRQHAKRWVILEAIAASFVAGRTYHEHEVNSILSAINEDHCTLRRTLVDEGILERDREAYRRSTPSPAKPGSLRASYEASLQTLREQPVPAAGHD